MEILPGSHVTLSCIVCDLAMTLRSGGLLWCPLQPMTQLEKLDVIIAEKYCVRSSSSSTQYWTVN